MTNEVSPETNFSVKFAQVKDFFRIAIHCYHIDETEVDRFFSLFDTL